MLFFASQVSMVLVVRALDLIDDMTYKTHRWLKDCWLARWSTLPLTQGAEKTNLVTFVALAAVAVLMVTLQASSWPLLCLRASSKLHREALWRLLRAPLDVPVAAVGQLLSRFARDLDCLDSRLLAMLAQALACVAALASALSAILVSSPLLAPAALLLALALYRASGLYSPVASQAALVVAALNGPLVAQLLECLEGRGELRCFGRSQQALQQGLQALEVNARAQVLNVALQRWFALQLELIGGLMLLCVAMCCACQRTHLGLKGLSLTYALTLTALAGL